MYFRLTYLIERTNINESSYLLPESLGEGDELATHMLTKS